MTEKRFMIIGENYTNIDMPVFVVCREDDCCFGVYESKEDAQRVCDKLNNLINENEQLKSRINDYDVALRTLQDLADKKLKENEQLKQEIKDLNDILARYEEKELENDLGRD